MVNWQPRTEHFATKVQCGVKLPTVDTLIRARVGITSEMRKEKSRTKKALLREIRSEIDQLIEQL